MAGFEVGPTVTQYRLKPSEGVKLNKIEALKKDLTLALKAKIYASKHLSPDWGSSVLKSPMTVGMLSVSER